MPTTDELLEQMEAEVLSTSAENRFIVDNNLRTITVPGSITVLGVEHDDDVHRLYFQMPKMYGEFDLSEFDIRINYVNAADKPDTYPVDDKETSGDNITFSWLVGRTAFEKMGEVKFNVCLRKTNGDGVVVKEFNTTIATLPPVLEGLETTELIVQQNPDVIESILQRLGVLEENGGGGGTSDYSDLENKPQLNGITLEGNKTLEDVGAQPKGNYLTSESDPTVPQWAKNPTKPTYTATEVGADASGTAESKVSAHNTSDDAHNDIRLLVQGLTTRLNALADSDDDTLDQMSEIVVYIKSNKSLIDGITTGKVNTSDIIDNLTTNVSNKPLSAAQGVALKALIDGITIPETLPNPQKLIFSGAVTGEYDGSTELNVNIPESASADIPRQEMQNTDTTVTLEPNKLYVFPEMASLTVTLATPSNTDIANEWNWFFDSGETACVFSLQNQDGSQVYTDAYSIDANMRYEVSVLNSVAYIKGVAITANGE